MMPKFQRRHYETIASVIKAVRKNGDRYMNDVSIGYEVGIDNVIAYFIKELEKDNPSFNVTKFYRACNEETT